jgi:hypothetical protein
VPIRHALQPGSVKVEIKKGSEFPLQREITGKFDAEVRKPCDLRVEFSRQYTFLTGGFPF